MKLKLDDQGHAVLQDGKPVYVKEDGTEVAFDALGTTQAITRLNAEAKSHRERAETAEKSLKGFEGITDPAKALEALVAIAQLDQNGTHAEICTGVHVVPRQLLQGLRIERAGFCQRIKPQSAGGVPCACDLPQASALFPAGFEPGRRAPAVPMG